MKIQIIKNPLQISNAVSVQHQGIEDYQKRYYCRKTKTWYLPLEEYASFKDQLSDYPEFEFEEKESKPVVFIKTIADRIEIKLSKFVDEFKTYLDFDGRRYNASVPIKVSMPNRKSNRKSVCRRNIWRQ